MFVFADFNLRKMTGKIENTPPCERQGVENKKVCTYCIPLCVFVFADLDLL